MGISKKVESGEENLILLLGELNADKLKRS